MNSRIPWVWAFLCAAGFLTATSARATDPGALSIQYNTATAVRGSQLILKWSGDYQLLRSPQIGNSGLWGSVTGKILVSEEGQRVLYQDATDPQGFFLLKTNSPMARFFVDPLKQIGYNDDDDENSKLFLIPEADRIRLGIVLPIQTVQPVITLTNLAPQPEYPIHLQSIITANDDGTQASTIAPSEIAQLVAEANVVYRFAGVRFVFDPAKDVLRTNSTILNHDFTTTKKPEDLTGAEPTVTDEEKLINAKARTQLAIQFPDRLVAFHRWGDKWVWSSDVHHWVLTNSTCGYSSWGMAFVAMGHSMPCVNHLAHESGHYLQICHPFVSGIGSIASAAATIKYYVENGTYSKANGLSALDGDIGWVLDTPPDTGKAIFESVGLDGYNQTNTLTIPVTFTGQSTPHNYVLDPDRHDIMAYYYGQNQDQHLTDQQISRVRDGLENGLRHRLLRPTFTTPKLQSLDEALAGEATEPRVFRTRTRQVVTAVRTSAATEELKLITWHLTSTNTLERMGDIQEPGVIRQLDAINLGLGLVATAVVTEDYALKVVVYQVDEDGTWQRKSSYIVPGLAVQEVSMARMGIAYFITATRTVAGNLQVQAWNVTANGEFSLVAEASGWGITANTLRACPIGRGKQAATAFSLTSGSLKLIAWQLTEDNQLIRSSELVAGEVSSVDCVGMDVDLLVTPVSTADKLFKLIAWRLDNEGKLSRADDYSARNQIAASAATRLSTEMAATATLSSAGVVSLELWKVTDNGGVISHAADLQGPTASSVSLCPIDWGKLVAATINSDGRLELRVYDAGKDR